MNRFCSVTECHVCCYLTNILNSPATVGSAAKGHTSLGDRAPFPLLLAWEVGCFGDGTHDNFGDALWSLLWGWFAAAADSTGNSPLWCAQLLWHFFKQSRRASGLLFFLQGAALCHKVLKRKPNREFLLDGFVSVTYLVQRHFLMSRSHIIIRVWRHLLETAVFITLVQTAGVIHPSNVLTQAELVQFLTPLLVSTIEFSLLIFAATFESLLYKINGLRLKSHHFVPWTWEALDAVDGAKPLVVTHGFNGICGGSSRRKADVSSSGSR